MHTYQICQKLQFCLCFYSSWQFPLRSIKRDTGRLENHINYTLICFVEIKNMILLECRQNFSELHFLYSALTNKKIFSENSIMDAGTNSSVGCSSNPCLIERNYITLHLVEDDFNRYHVKRKTRRKSRKQVRKIQRDGDGRTFPAYRERMSYSS